MRATPVQKYALRLLMAAEKIQPPPAAEWQKLQSGVAEAFLAPFGGVAEAIRKTILPSEAISESASTGKNPENGQLLPRNKSEIEISHEAR